MTGAAILGLGDYRPSRVVNNDEISLRVDTNDAWIRERTGIVTRHVAGDDEDIVTMAAAAGAKALAAAGVDSVDLVLLATCSMLQSVPGGSAAVAERIGLGTVGAADVNAACAGFCYALSWAADAVRGGSADRVLVVASEKLSQIVDWDDRGTCILFGDGAGAAVVGRAEQQGIAPVAWGSDGAKHSLIGMTENDHLTMDGTAVFRWATTELADVARSACRMARIDPSELAAFVPHQANLRIVDSLARTLGIPGDRVARDVVDMGNTSAASIPLALTRLSESGRVTAGDPVLLLAFGAGLTYAAQVVRLP